VADIHRVPPKTLGEVAREWDSIASVRARQTSSGRDLSLTYVLIPTMRKLITDAKPGRVLDVGCGTGLATHALTRRQSQVVGIDVSATSIDLARSAILDSNIHFLRSSVQAYAKTERRGSFHLITANMSLMTSPNLRATLQSISHLLSSNGTLALTLTHPWFWPAYWGYASQPWFRYDSEIFIEAPFQISLERDVGLVTTHIHRPLHKYFDELRVAGFVVERLLEPMPTPKVERLYPTPWAFPRFLGLGCIKA
jgi:SAM-dependent methyltransferase